VPGGFEFSRLPTVRGCPRTGDAEFLSAVAQGAAAGQGPAAFPFAGWLGASSYPWPEVSPCRWRGLPLAGWLRVPPGQGPEVSRYRWLRISPRQRLGDPRCRGGSGFPRARGSELPVAGGFGSLRARGSEIPVAGWPGVSPVPGGGEFPLRRWLRVPLVPKARGFPVAGWLRMPSGRDQRPPVAGWLQGFPLCRWLRVSPSPATVPGGEEISTPVPRAAQEVSADNFKILWPSTSRPQLTLSCPPRQAFLHRILHSAVHRGCVQLSAGYRPANLISGSLASVT
jgi:hypothetical protein